MKKKSRLSNILKGLVIATTIATASLIPEISKSQESFLIPEKQNTIVSTPEVIPVKIPKKTINYSTLTPDKEYQAETIFYTTNHSKASQGLFYSIKNQCFYDENTSEKIGRQLRDVGDGYQALNL
jgi:hypothetical protein